MVESLRKLVSGNRRRFTDEEFSLDLTYIIPDRIIAMSYPASGFESFYRNPIDKVRSGETPPTDSILCEAGLDFPKQQAWQQVLDHKHIREGHVRRSSLLRRQSDKLSLAGSPRTALRFPLPNRKTRLLMAQR